MKPRTKRQHHVVEVNKSLPKITEAQINWGLENVLLHKGVRRANGDIICLDCAHTHKSSTKQAWQDTVEKVTCPNCKRKLEIMPTRKSCWDDSGTMGIITTHKGYQVIRKFYFHAYFKAKHERRTYYYEFSRVYIDEKGNHEIIGFTIYNSYYGFRTGNEFDLKNPKTLDNHDFEPYLYYPRVKYLPRLIAAGYNKTKKYKTIELMKILLVPCFETIYKWGEEQLIDYVLESNHRAKEVQDHWYQVKLVHKNKFKIKSWRYYFDYLRMAKQFNKDIKSPRWAIPSNLEKLHDRYSDRIRKQREKERLQRKLEQMAKEEEAYSKKMAPFKDLKLVDKQLIIVPLMTVEEVREEGNIQRHCVYSSDYHNKPYSILLSARIGEKRIETIEFSIGSYVILQARGIVGKKTNKATRYHKRIIQLVQDNADLIRRMHKGLMPKKKRAKKQIQQVA